MQRSATCWHRGETHDTQPCYWKVRCLDKVNCFDSSVVNREKESSRRAFVLFSGRWVGKVGWLIFWVCLCLYSLWREPSDDFMQVVQPCQLHEMSHTPSACGKPGHYWRSCDPTAIVLREFCTTALGFHQQHLKVEGPTSPCVPHPWLGFKPEEL